MDKDEDGWDEFSSRVTEKWSTLYLWTTAFIDAASLRIVELLMMFTMDSQAKMYDLYTDM